MKSWLGCLCAVVVLLCACDGGVIVERYLLELPELPEAWGAVLGAPRWRIEWQNPQGRAEMVDAGSGAGIEISVPMWASAVLAWPYWSEKGLPPGIFRPAGGIFPFDAAGVSFSLSWAGGVDAVLYRELGKAFLRDGGGRVPDGRQPWNFNWPRFRETLSDPAVNAEFRADPWLADWPAIAEKILRTGFDKRRLVPRVCVDVAVPVMAGPWIGTSPFAAPLSFVDTPVFPVAQSGSGEAGTWVCAGGVLRCNSGAWIFREWE